MIPNLLTEDVSETLANYEDHLRRAHTIFYEAHYPCEYMSSQGRCINVKTKHQKGHQIKSGKIVKVGEFCDYIDRSVDCDEFVEKVQGKYESYIQGLQGDHSFLRLAAAQRHHYLLGRDILGLQKPGPSSYVDASLVRCQLSWTSLTTITNACDKIVNDDRPGARVNDGLGPKPFLRQDPPPIYPLGADSRAATMRKRLGKGRGPNAPSFRSALLLRDQTLGLEKLSHATCYVCLLAFPVYTLNCGHMVCNDCADDFSNLEKHQLDPLTAGQVRGTNNHNQSDHIQCPFPNCSGLALRKQEPREAAPRVLSLDG